MHTKSFPRERLVKKSLNLAYTLARLEALPRTRISKESTQGRRSKDKPIRFVPVKLRPPAQLSNKLSDSRS